MILHYRFCTIGLYLSILLHQGNSYVLLTANIEDLRRIAQKFVSNSLADKIAQFILDTTDNIDNDSSEIDHSKYGKNLSKERNASSNRFTTDIHLMPEEDKSKGGRHDRLKINKYKNEKNNTVKEKKETLQKKPTEVKKTNYESLEYYRTNNYVTSINPKLMINLENIQESDYSSDLKQSRKEFHKMRSFGNIKNNKSDTDEDISGSMESKPSTKGTKSESSEDESEDFQSNNKLNDKSTEISTKSKVTTEKSRIDFDQYVNNNHPKSKVLATSGPVELTKLSTGVDAGSSEIDYD